MSENILFLHCRLCVVCKPSNISPEEWSKLLVAYDKDNNSIEIWCQRHDCIVGIFKLAEEGLLDKCECEHCKEMSEAKEEKSDG